MAEKPAGSSGARPGASPTGRGARVPRDPFVARVVPDPANLDAESPLVMRGYVGDSDEEGYTRIYCGSLLEVYADVRDEDILHYEASDGGQEHTLWVRRDAQVKHGGRGKPKGEAAAFLGGPLLRDYRGSPGAGAAAGAQAQATGLCTWICPTAPGVCPPSIGCQGGGLEAAAQGPIGVTGWHGCGVTQQLGCPRTRTCPPTYMPGCPSTSTCPPTDMLGCPRTSTCPPTYAPGCQDPTAATMCFICPPITSDCPVEQGGGAVEARAVPAAGAVGTYYPACQGVKTAATLCTQIGCRTQFGIQCTHLFHCPPGTAATVCTQYGCPGPVTYQYGCTLGFTCTYVGCPPPG